MSVSVPPVRQLIEPKYPGQRLRDLVSNCVRAVTAAILTPVQAQTGVTV